MSQQEANTQYKKACVLYGEPPRCVTCRQQEVTGAKPAGLIEIKRKCSAPNNGPGGTSLASNLCERPDEYSPNVVKQ